MTREYRWLTSGLVTITRIPVVRLSLVPVAARSRGSSVQPWTPSPAELRHLWQGVARADTKKTFIHSSCWSYLAV